MLQLSPVPALYDAEPLNIGAGRRVLAIGLSVLIPALLLLMLLTFGVLREPDRKEVPISVVNLEASEVSEQSSEPASQPQEQSEKPASSPQPAPAAAPSTPLPPPPVAAPEPPPAAPAPAQPQPPQTKSTIGVRMRDGPVGPPNTGGSSAYRDSERVGTAPNGEALYAAAWYREPSDGELRGYLSTASGPGWGLIACRTAPDYRVEDCVGLDEYPNGSQITRAVLAAAWQFRVRPPRVGGQSMVGAWVRIRIDYGVGRRSGGG
ncbi:hypothetical protein [Sphingopyxis macrogoltabida]|uniref:Protein TonB n=1 Tax=Sphingopyxis macrogoltabida TaxID=33050 RepID=A0AAC9AVB5_SPHMC|nr:hypothetical protein [Sphingopyxis macrogoltabida]ALJ12726.1 hypothetical protein LH19_07580 [Sphingopyxis macrogoltabida]AMU89807.1 hypothetical protein ATM17_12260 [Sphingopyxis macrogoltabida]